MFLLSQSIFNTKYNTQDSRIGLDLLADYLLFCLNRARCFSYVSKFGLSAPTSSSARLLASIRQTGGMGGPQLPAQLHLPSVTDAPAIRRASLLRRSLRQHEERPADMAGLNSSAAFFLKTYRSGALGRLTLDRLPHELNT